MLNTNTPKLGTSNTFSGNQTIENAQMGNSTDNAAIKIVARTDENQYSLPAIYMDCYGRGGCMLFFDTKLRALIDGKYYDIAGE